MRAHETVVITSFLFMAAAFARPAHATEKVTSANLQATTPAAPPDAHPDEGQGSLGTRFGLFCGPEMKATVLAGTAALLVGAQSGLVINRNIVLGTAGYALATTQSPAPELARATGPSHIQFGYVGARFGYIFRPQAPVHFTAAMLVGGGGVSVLTRDLVHDVNRNHGGGFFFALEPQADLEINLHRHIRLAIGGSYRFVDGFDQPGLHTSDLSGPAGSVTMRFGSF